MSGKWPRWQLCCACKPLRERTQAGSLHTWPRLPRSPAQVGPGRAGAEPSLRGPRLGKGGFSLLLAILGAWATVLRNWIREFRFFCSLGLRIEDRSLYSQHNILF